MACSSPFVPNELASLDEPPPASQPADGSQAAQTSREDLKLLFRELVGLVDSLRAEEDAHDLESDVAVRVREARQALEKSLASHGLLRNPATVASTGHTRRESIRSTKRFIAKPTTSLKATLMFGKR